MRKTSSHGWGLAWRLARREMRGGLRGFKVLLACLFLGVAAIAAAGSLSAALRGALTTDARQLLGGDLAVRLTHRAVLPAERALIDGLGTIVDQIEMRAMARAADGHMSLVELKAVAGPYPLYGSLDLAPSMTPDQALERRDGVWGAVADADLLTRLGLKVGDLVGIGDARFQLRATIRHEPDRVATVFSLGPRLMVAAEALPSTGLVQPGSLIRYTYLLRLHPGVSADAAKAVLTGAFPEAGWNLRVPSQAAPGVERFIDNMTLFLTLVGLVSLLIGGIGVANAVKGFIDGRIGTIAILKSLGAPRRLVFAVYGLQTGALALVGIAGGAALGAAVPMVVAALAGDALPLRLTGGLYPRPLLLAAVFGALTAATFSLWPLARAAEIPAGALFRDLTAPLTARPGRAAMLAVGAAAVALAGLAITSAPERGLAAWFVGGSALALGLFRLVAAGLRWLARRAARRRGGGTVWRLALGNLHRPGAATVPVVVSFGLGLSVLAAIVLIQANLSLQLGEKLPREAPAFFFIDIQHDQAEAFDAAIAAIPGVGPSERALMVRGRITRLNGQPVEHARVAPDSRWAVQSDRGFTSAALPPPDTRIVAGQWWPPDYAGPPLVSLDAGIAKGFGLKVGDTVSVNVLGRELTMTIASLREIDWSSLGMNFTFVLSPGALAGAPNTWVATVHAAPEAEEALERAVVGRLPNVSAIRVREALGAVRTMIANAGLAVKAAAALTLVTGALVLAGAVAAGRRRRLYEAVILKVLGARRHDLLAAFLVEYGLLGLATGLVAGLVGSVAAWAVLVYVMHADWVFLPLPLLATMAVCVAATLLLGYAGTWRVLGGKVAPHLRSD